MKSRQGDDTYHERTLLGRQDRPGLVQTPRGLTDVTDLAPGLKGFQGSFCGELLKLLVFDRKAVELFAHASHQASLFCRRVSTSFPYMSTREVRTVDCLPNIRLPFLLSLLSPSVALDGLIQRRPRLAKDNRAIILAGKFLLGEDIGILRRIHRRLRIECIPLQNIVFGNILIILALLEAQTDLKGGLS